MTKARLADNVLRQIRERHPRLTTKQQDALEQRVLAALSQQNDDGSTPGTIDAQIAAVVGAEPLLTRPVPPIHIVAAHILLNVKNPTFAERQAAHKEAERLLKDGDAALEAVPFNSPAYDEPPPPPEELRFKQTMSRKELRQHLESAHGVDFSKMLPGDQKAMLDYWEERLISIAPPANTMPGEQLAKGRHIHSQLKSNAELLKTADAMGNIKVPTDKKGVFDTIHARTIEAQQAKLQAQLDTGPNGELLATAKLSPQDRLTAHYAEKGNQS